MRRQGHVRRPDEIKVAYLERSGDISVVMKDKEIRILDVKVEDGVQTIRIQLDN